MKKLITLILAISVFTLYSEDSIQIKRGIIKDQHGIDCYVDTTFLITYNPHIVNIFHDDDKVKSYYVSRVVVPQMNDYTIKQTFMGKDFRMDIIQDPFDASVKQVKISHYITSETETYFPR